MSTIILYEGTLTSSEGQTFYCHESPLPSDNVWFGYYKTFLNSDDGCEVDNGN